jgi:hypothetical protein
LLSVAVVVVAVVAVVITIMRLCYDPYEDADLYDDNGYQQEYSKTMAATTTTTTTTTTAMIVSQHLHLHLHLHPTSDLHDARLCTPITYDRRSVRRCRAFMIRWRCYVQSRFCD